MTETNWLHEAEIRTYNLDHLASPHVVDSITVSIKRKQPNHNCTAAVLINLMLWWIIIPCDEAINASFVCQSELDIKYRPPAVAVNPHNATCAAGSISLSNSQKCYLLLEAQKQISFSTVMKTCHAENGDILEIEVTDYVGSAVDNQKLMWAFLESYEKTYDNHFKDKGPSHELLKWIVFGNYLSKNSMASKLANILKWTLSHGPEGTLPLADINIFVAVNSYCGIMRYMGYARLYHDKLPDGFVKGWGVKYIPCHDSFDVDAIVCEKPIIPFVMSSCGIGFFECEDGTCILSTYRCDFVYDCFDKSDEAKCEEYNQMTNQSINIPCAMNNNCSLPHDQSRVFLHDMCDGIFSTLVFVKEKQVCHKNEIVRKDVLHLQHDKNTIISLWTAYHDHTRILTAFDNYLYRPPPPPEYMPAIARLTHTYKNKKREILCNNQSTTYIDIRCRITVNNDNCIFGPTKDICSDIICPGMFKCYGYYCIQISQVCDGQSDCLYGDDEAHCDRLVCPGSIKCRGENRCVGSEDVCDGTANCLYSFDDEVSCHICPNDCTCDGYMVFCTSVNTWGNNKTRLDYSKGLNKKGFLKTITMDYLRIETMLYLDISQCSLTDVSFTSKDDIIPQLLHANFSNNHLVNINFTSNRFYSFVLIMDVGNNFITHIHFKNILFKYLTVLILSGNPIKEVHLININSTLFTLKLLELKEVKFSPYMIINPTAQCIIVVSHPRVCCILPSTAICRSFNQRKVLCFGLFSGLASEVYTYTVVILSIAIFIFKLFKSVFNSSWINNHKLYYIASTANYTIADLFSIMYNVALIAAHISHVNWLFWRKSLFCRFLRGIISLSLRGSLIYKTMCIVIIALKIIYPFRHQLGRLKYLPLISFFIWITLISLDVISAAISTDIYLDQFCTFLNCHDKLTYMLLGQVVVDFTCIILFVVFLWEAYLLLRERSRISSGIQHKKQLNFNKITFKLGKLLYSDIVLRIAFFIIYIVKYSYPIQVELCFAIAFYILPLNIIIFNLLNAF